MKEIGLDLMNLLDGVTYIGCSSMRRSSFITGISKIVNRNMLHEEREKERGWLSTTMTELNALIRKHKRKAT